jgi:hypothetical protein
VSDLPYTLKEVANFRHAPDRHTRRLALTAQRAMLKADLAEGAFWHCQDRLAEAQQTREEPLLVVLHRDGFVGVWAEDWRPVKIACMPDFGRGREEEAEAYMISRLPMMHRELYEKTGRQIVAGNCRGCMDRTAFELFVRVMSEHQAIRDMAVSLSPAAEQPQMAVAE